MPGDDDEGVAGVGVDRDPLARARGCRRTRARSSPRARTAGSAAVQREADRARAVIAESFQRCRGRRRSVGLVDDLVGRGDHRPATAAGAPGGGGRGAVGVDRRLADRHRPAIAVATTWRSDLRLGVGHHAVGVRAVGLLELHDVGLRAGTEVAVDAGRDSRPASGSPGARGRRGPHALRAACARRGAGSRRPGRPGRSPGCCWHARRVVSGRGLLGLLLAVGRAALAQGRAAAAGSAVRVGRAVITSCSLRTKARLTTPLTARWYLRSKPLTLLSVIGPKVPTAGS